MKSLAELTQEVEALTAEKASLLTKLTEAENLATQALEAQQKAEQERDAAIQAKTTALNEKAELETQLGAEKAKVATLEANKKTVVQEAAEICAAAGVKPAAKVISKENSGGSDTMTRSEWNKLGVKERAEYLRNGGKLTD